MKKLRLWYWPFSLLFLSCFYVTSFSFSFLRVQNSFQRLPISFLRLFDELRTKRGFAVFPPLGKILCGFAVINGIVILGYESIAMAIQGMNIRKMTIFRNEQGDTFRRHLQQKIVAMPLIGKILSAACMQGKPLLYQYDTPLEHLNGYGKCLAMVNYYLNPFVHFFPPKNRAYDVGKIKKNNCIHSDMLKAFDKNNRDIYSLFLYIVNNFLTNTFKILPREASVKDVFNTEFIHTLQEYRTGIKNNQQIASDMCSKEGVRKLLEYYTLGLIDQYFLTSPQRAHYRSSNFEHYISDKYVKEFFVRVMSETFLAKLNEEFYQKFLSCVVKEEQRIEKKKQQVVNLLYIVKKSLFAEKMPFSAIAEAAEFSPFTQAPIPVIACGEGWLLFIDNFINEYRKAILEK